MSNNHGHHHDHNGTCSHDHAHDHSHHHGDVHEGADHGSMKSYIIGFVLSVILTVVPFWMVMQSGASHEVVLGTILTLAIIQILVHLVYFLHMNGKSDQRWNTVAFAFTVLVVILVVGGCVWIMGHAMNNLMPVPSLENQ